MASGILSFLSTHRTLYMIRAPLTRLTAIRASPSPYHLYISPLRLTPIIYRSKRTMSSPSKQQSPQKPQILGTDELKTEAKWLKLEKIRWKDQEGKEVCYNSTDVRMGSIRTEADDISELGRSQTARPVKVRLTVSFSAQPLIPSHGSAQEVLLARSLRRIMKLQG